MSTLTDLSHDIRRAAEALDRYVEAHHPRANSAPLDADLQLAHDLLERMRSDLTPAPLDVELARADTVRVGDAVYLADLTATGAHKWFTISGTSIDGRHARLVPADGMMFTLDRSELVSVMRAER